MQVQLLGPVTVRDGTTPIDLGGPRNRALVARLALAAPRPVGVDQLVDDLWGDDPPRNAHNALQSVVSRTRARLPEGTLESVDGGYRLAVVPDDVDVLRFDALVSAGRPAEALALVHGTPFGGIDEAPFAGAACAAWEERRLGALEERICADLASGRYAVAALVAELSTLVDEHPYRESFATALMRVLAANGRTADALETYEHLRTRLADDLGLDPSPAAGRLQAAILRGETDVTDPASSPAAAASPEPPPTNLRRALTSFVGRSEAVDEVSGLLDKVRLVTLVGPGGAGKTRLAVETSRHLAERYPDGVWLVELATVTDAVDIADAVTAALDLREVTVLDRTGEVRKDDRSRLIAALSAAKALIVMDNCEHLVAGAAAFVDDLLQAVDGVDVLATSREPLGILGEAVYPVASLDVPDDSAGPGEAATYSAVALFVERARAASPSFVLDEETLPSVVEICRRLDGQPLPIELAAARLRVLSAAQVARRLGDRFRLLTGGSRTALPRHRTLRAVVDWSWGLLDPRERALAERVSVFPAGISAQAAAAMLGSEDAPVDEVTALDLLSALADKSLLVPIRRTGDEPRFRMLETLREYGNDRLVEQGESDDVRRRQLAWATALVTAQEPRLRRYDQLDALAILDAERGNVLSALRYAIDAGEGWAAADLVTGLIWYFALRSQHEEVGELAAQVLAMGVPLPATSELACVAILVAASFGGAIEEGHLSSPYFERFQGVLGRPDLDRDAPLVVLLTAAAALFVDSPDDDRPPETVARALANPDPWVRAMAQFLLAGWRENAGLREDDTEESLESAINGFRQVGDRWGEAMGNATVAMAYERRGRFELARASLENALDRMRELGADEDLVQIRSRLIALRARDAGPGGVDLDAIRRELGDAAEEARASRHGATEAFVVVARIGVERRLGDPREARRLADDLFDRWRSMPALVRTPQFEAMARAEAALAALAFDPADARRLLQGAVAAVRRTSDMPVASRVGVVRACLLAADGDDEAAAAALGAARALRGSDDLSDSDVATVSASLRKRLGDDRFEALYDEGAGLSRTDALPLALGPAD